MLRLVCGAFFGAFSFVYLFCLQGDLLAEAQYVYSDGVTRYSILIGALIITFLLGILQWVVTRLLRFGKNYYALSYFIPALVLAILTSVNTNALEDFSFGVWLWLFPLLTLIYIYIIKSIGKFDTPPQRSTNVYAARSLWVNAVILLALFVMIGSVGNTNDVRHYEQKTERLILEGRYDDAGRVGEKSLMSSRRLTELRMYALARLGHLGDRMFDYPQYYGTAGLLDVADTTKVYYRFDAADICTYLGVKCGGGFRSTGAYLDVVEKHLLTCPDTSHVILDHKSRLNDYRMAYLLLDKDLRSFVSELEVSRYDTLPQAYKEALLLVRDNAVLDSSFKIDTTLYAMVDSFTVLRYDEYNEMKADLTDSVERQNRLRRKFGKTYWWYYEYM